ncbi:MAG: hypothetical protein ACI8W7_001294 [Gammaproteobacteria bacterium]|jgi:hypothetical protein
MATQHTLSAEQRGTLDIVLNLIIAPSKDRRMPGAAEYDVFAYIIEAAPSALPVLCVELDELNASAQSQFGTSFASLALSDAQNIVDERRRVDPQFMAELARQTVACYYQQDQVVTAIGMQARPPFPQGYDVHIGDLSLLDPVRARGQMYRDVD